MGEQYTLFLKQWFKGGGVLGGGGVGLLQGCRRLEEPLFS